MFVINLTFLAVTVASVLMAMALNALPTQGPLRNFITIGSFYLASLIILTFFFADGENSFQVANFGIYSIKRYYKNLLSSLKPAAFFSLFLTAFVAIVVFSLPFYLNVWMDNLESNFLIAMMGLLFVALVFWFVVISLLSLQWYQAVRMVLKDGLRKSVKKCFMIFFDNPWLSILVFINNLFMLALTVVTFGLVPGLSGLSLSNVQALRLLMYKYDWLEVNPGLDKKQAKNVPWDELLVKDRRALGPRKLKSFIFPWKD